MTKLVTKRRAKAKPQRDVNARGRPLCVRAKVSSGRARPPIGGPKTNANPRSTRAGSNSGASTDARTRADSGTTTGRVHPSPGRAEPSGARQTKWRLFDVAARTRSRRDGQRRRRRRQRLKASGEERTGRTRQGRGEASAPVCTRASGSSSSSGGWGGNSRRARRAVMISRWTASA
ncbi:Hypothetical predicted protein [Olea europaea subsp. europaea]|uniref:Uncharacterized protein n=1 Tax=Olea europaea subsp. europaea TaxID=158383 RepID=A0A8S0R9X6_OLEEU|nr:Hypothetical predicted protein [Olea europaea subsp. europaea]